MANNNNDVEVRITGSVDPSLAASTTAAKGSILELGKAADTLTISQRSMAQALLDGRISAEALAQYLGKTKDAKEALAAITGAVTEAQLAEAESADVAAAAQIN